MEPRTHTTTTRQIARLVNNLKKKQRYYRTRWLDADVIIGALEYKINTILKARHKHGKD
jgi:hypothetical protein